MKWYEDIETTFEGVKLLIKNPITPLRIIRKHREVFTGTEKKTLEK